MQVVIERTTFNATTNTKQTQKKTKNNSNYIENRASIRATTMAVLLIFVGVVVVMTSESKFMNRGCVELLLCLSFFFEYLS